MNTAEFKHGDEVIVSFGVIQGTKAIVNWVEGERVWLMDIEAKKIEGGKGFYTQHVPNPVPINWIKPRSDE